MRVNITIRTLSVHGTVDARAEEDIGVLQSYTSCEGRRGYRGVAIIYLMRGQERI